jgi:hypothetical protein
MTHWQGAAQADCVSTLQLSPPADIAIRTEIYNSAEMVNRGSTITFNLLRMLYRKQNSWFGYRKITKINPQCGKLYVLPL